MRDLPKNGMVRARRCSTVAAIRAKMMKNDVSALIFYNRLRRKTNTHHVREMCTFGEDAQIRAAIFGVNCAGNCLNALDLLFDLW